LAFSSTAETAGTYSCSLDGASAACVSPTNYTGLGNGTHNFSVTATDLAGNVSIPQYFSWAIDTTPPVTSISATQAANNGNSITFTISSNKPWSTFRCALDGAALQSCAAIMTYGGLACGSHTFVAYATDAAGNTDPTGASYPFTVVIPMTTTITGESPSAAITSQTSISFTFTSNYSTATFQCSLDGAAPIACSSPQSYSNLNGNNNGNPVAHTFLVQAIGSSGQVDNTGASYNWTVDTTLPGFGSRTVTVTSSSFTVSWVTTKPTTTGFFWGLGTDTSNVVPEDNVYTTNHSVTIATGITPNTVYSYKMTGHDQVGNLLLSSRNSLRTNP
jgi:hypothetical protein